MCQDYATTFNGRRVRGVALADGCSGSARSDVGARVVAEAAAAVLVRLPDRHFHGGEDVLAGALARGVRRRMRAVAEGLGLGAGVLDATLLVAVFHRALRRLLLFGWGDGHVLLRGASGVVHYALSSPGNAPHYLSYHLDPAREAAYLRATGGEVGVSLREGLATGASPAAPRRWGASPFAAVVEGNRLPTFAAVFSDGVDSFVHGADGRRLDASEVIDELSDFKNPRGRFVQRRARCFQRHLHRPGAALVQADDTALACLHFGRGTRGKGAPGGDRP